MHRFQPRSRYSNLLEVEGVTVYPDTDTGMMQMNMDTWYRLLNWGLKLAAGAGSATGVKQVPVGYNRSYLRTNNDATVGEFNDAWAAGRNFVTNGPMIFLCGADGLAPGTELSADTPPASLEFQLTVLSDHPLKTIEIVQNGSVIRQFVPNSQRQSQHCFSLRTDRSCWIAARCTARDDLLADDGLQRYDNPPRQRPSRLRFAHTSPIYFTVNGRPAIVRKSVEEGLQMLDRLEVFADKQAAPEFREDFRQAVKRGRDLVLEKL